MFTFLKLRDKYMTYRPIEFLVSATTKAPLTLLESIRQVSNASAGFCRSWLTKDISDALATSEEAFGLFDHIQNELLRHRDKKSKLHGWMTSPFKAALSQNVGQLLAPALSTDKAHFLAQTPGSGSMPTNSILTPISLVEALNKLKHRDTNAVNFTISASNVHALFIFTHGGMGKPDSISTFEVHTFCNACKIAAQAI
jgi:hypothetical protein